MPEKRACDASVLKKSSSDVGHRQSNIVVALLLAAPIALVCTAWIVWTNGLSWLFGIPIYSVLCSIIVLALCGLMFCARMLKSGKITFPDFSAKYARQAKH